MNACVPGDVLRELLTLLKLEKIEENIFRGQSQDLGFGNVFGGQVLGQALSAASQTVPPERSAHSLHAYFMRGGDATQPIVYQVDVMRDGKSFSTRRTVAIQKGRPIFFMSVSFQKHETGFSHQDEMPAVPDPESIESELAMAQRLKEKIPVTLREKILCTKPIEIRPIDPINPFDPVKKPPHRYAWIKADGELPAEVSTHRYLLAYASDFGLVSTALYPHGHTFWEPEMQVASLDHAMWFHRDFRFDEWLLYEMRSPNACGARGLINGRVFTRDGRLVASTAQEGLIRFHGQYETATCPPVAAKE
ncbi:MAG: acyl-CoA thioesterase II [Desulfosarcinaceae bacterium]|nr:acyl-CoA thioesterase II [Desulfosarcinaceae bacterium]